MFLVLVSVLGCRAQESQRFPTLLTPSSGAQYPAPAHEIKAIAAHEPSAAPTAVSLSVEDLRHTAIIGFAKVKPVRTRWGTPWNHEEICRNMDAILTGNGIEPEHVRVRMIAHSIVASGWSQKVWNYNAWGVQQGTWKGPWYEMNTTEIDSDGDSYMVRDATWRAFSGWQQAVDDYFNRIRPTSRRPSYKQAYKYLVDPDIRSDRLFWAALGSGNYYTAIHFTEQKFAVLCKAVRRILFESSV